MSPRYGTPAGRSATLCLSLLAAACFANVLHAEEYARSFSVSNRAKVHVDTNEGSVRVTTGDTQQIEVRVEYTGYEENRTLHIESHQQGDAIELTARVADRLPFAFGVMRKLHIEVSMPKNGDLRVETGDGSISVSGLSGAIDLHSGDGSLTVKSLAGVVSLHTGDGSIEGSDLDGRFDAVSGDGSIRLMGRFDVLTARSGDGKIDLGAIQGSKLDSPWKVESGDGSIEVALPGDLPVDVDASTGDGHISTDIPITVVGTTGKSRIQGKMNGGGQTLTIHTGDGSVRLKRA